jgi:nucleotide-binding universal stress UspA family protein
MAHTPESLLASSFFQTTEDDLVLKLQEAVDALNDSEMSIQQFVEEGELLPSIEKIVAKTKADLIVMGRTGKGSLFDKLIGSVATKVALEGPCPVLIVPPQFVAKPLQEVVYATQLEYDESSVLDRVVPLMTFMGGRLTFLKVSSLMQADRHDDQLFINQIIQRYQLGREDIIISDSGDVVEGIEAYCQSIKADLLIVSARKRSLLESILGGRSVTKKLVLETQIPLLVYRLSEDDTK